MDAQTNTTPAQDTTISLAELFDTHRAMMVAHDALYEADNDIADQAQGMLYKEIMESRKEILARRPRTLEEVALKAGLMMGDRAFVYWDVDGTDVEGHFPSIVASLIPVGMDPAPD